MRLKLLALSLAFLGIELILGARVLDSYNVGSCPANDFSCDYTMTFEGVTFWIGATAARMAVVGALTLVSSGVVFSYLESCRKDRRQS
jgi:hypothetical protein